ncbi:SNF2-related protein [Fontivita pretiosa]|uniref:DEAD/DEAH box helicase n=1 Tax=Fontivita pretiosa TaxID=2989684 RepID=UPI003D17D989
MSLLERAAREFDPPLLARGRQYFEAGAVRIIKATQRDLHARVQGSELYDVKLSWNAAGELTDAQCTCAYAAGQGICKHMWAALLEADDQQRLPRLSGDDDGDGQDGADDGPGGSALNRSAALPQARRGALAIHLSVDGHKPSPWKRQLAAIRQAMRYATPAPPPPRFWSPTRRLVYLINIARTTLSWHEQLTVMLGTQVQDRHGRWSGPKCTRLRYDQAATLPDPQDQQIVQMLLGTPGDYDDYDAPMDSGFAIDPLRYELLLRPIVQSGRCFVALGLEDTDIDPTPLRWDDGPPWQFWIELNRDESGERYRMQASLRREDGSRMSGQEPLLVLASGLMIARGAVARLEHFGAFAMLQYLREHERGVSLSVQQGQEMLEELLSISPLPRLDFPAELRVEQVTAPMRPRLKIAQPKRRSYDDGKLLGTLSFDYGGRIVEEGGEWNLYDPATRTVVVRDPAAEAAAAARLDELGFRHRFDYSSWNRSGLRRRLAPSRLNRVVLTLVAEGWLVEAEGKLYRQPGEFKINVSSGIDWFELSGEMDFGDGVRASLPKLLAALRKGEKTVQLDDGTVGILPEQWLSQYGLLARVAQAKTGDDDQPKITFDRRQVGLLDALLSTMPQATFDASFEQARNELRRFEGITPMDPPGGFQGQLRPYQRDGLGWLVFLNRFGFGGCLADDMGLGKTVQVLALLEMRRQSNVGKPSLVVVPRSLVFNWIEEARRFTPQLRVLNHTGVLRSKTSEHFSDYDVILTTYGTLRLDAAFLKDFHFDYAILDEAQAIKNASSESAKAARLLRADHRLALSGTPVQNHLGELWSLFEFLNPGMLGTASVFRSAGNGSVPLDRDGRELLARALRPFILRRTKDQVATDLPEKTEQTIWCDLEPEQRKLYDELRDHYRASLLERIAAEGLNRAKIQVLEALLRLRQAACHPGLIDKSRAEHGSAKLDALLPQIAEVIEEGHKALVFSQFTSMLAIVRKHLDRQKLAYEYLDGKTRDRQARVERFQNDPECKLFLISLKAGGLGLNLTAAEYVFLLDPWWNPAIESQAIDRAHRIGQTRHVFAYRLIARDTVEQKVLELQQRKKDLADMIINADNSLISKLGREDLELLLS